jgi:hypothetical protein
MNEDTDKLERDVERTRADLDATLKALKSKTSIDKLGDQAIDYLRESGGSDLGQLVWQQARDHPLPLLTIAAGVVWLAADQGRRPSRTATAKSALRTRREPATGGPEGAVSGTRGSDEPERDPFVETYDTDDARDWGATALETVEENPLWSSGAGFAIGLAIGAVAAYALSGRANRDVVPDTRPRADDRTSEPANAVPPARSAPRRTEAGNASGRAARRDESLDETFPASDPPPPMPGAT